MVTFPRLSSVAKESSPGLLVLLLLSTLGDLRVFEILSNVFLIKINKMSKEFIL